MVGRRKAIIFVTLRLRGQTIVKPIESVHNGGFRRKFFAFVGLK